jgi:hypothetical protein
MLAADKQRPIRLIPDLSSLFVSQQFDSPSSFLEVGQSLILITNGKIKAVIHQQVSSITTDAHAISSPGTPQ